jgi:Cytochrome c554 and c-prime
MMHFRTVCFLYERLPVRLLFLSAAILTISHIKRQQSDIVGRVSGEMDEPVVDARVGLQGSNERTNTDDSGRFRLPRPARLGVRITAWKSDYLIAGVPWAGDEEVILRLRKHSTQDDPAYDWLDPGPDPTNTENCANCHGEIYRQWSASSHARSAVNRHFLHMFYGTDWHGKANTGWNFQDDQPDARAVCSACHVPTVVASSPVAEDPVRAKGVTREGIHCDFCHKIADTEFTKSLDSLGLQHGRDALRMVRPASSPQVFFGPRDDVDRGRDTFSPLYRSSYYCASCHEGTLFGIRAYETFSEWLASGYAKQGVECQACHMKPNGSTKNTAPGHGGVDRDVTTVGTHHFPGSTDDELLQSCVELSMRGSRDGTRIQSIVTVQPKQVGHRLPTGSPERHLILTIRAKTDLGDELKLAEGPTVPSAGGIGPFESSHFAGAPGKLYGKLLRGPDGSVPSPFWRSVAVEEDSRLEPDQPDEAVHVFELKDNARDVVLTATLRYRRFYKKLMEEKSWPDADIILAERQIVLEP